MERGSLLIRRRRGFCAASVLSLKVIFLVFSVEVQGSLSRFNTSSEEVHKEGYCSMYGICAQRSDGKVLNCANDHLSTKPDDLLSSKIQSLCPTITDNACCNAAQFETLREQVQQAVPLLVGCPACLRNFLNLFCELSCSPNQSLFINVTSAKQINNTLTVNGIDFFLTSTFGEELYNSCKDVKFGSVNTRVMDLIGAGAQNYKDFLAFLGRQAAPNTPGSPYEIDFQTNAPLTSGMKPMNTTVYSCGDSLLGCSCGDCFSSPACSVVTPPALPEKGSCKIAMGSVRVKCIELSLAVLYAAAISVFLLWGILRRKGQSRPLSERKPLFNDHGGNELCGYKLKNTTSDLHMSEDPPSVTVLRPSLVQDCMAQVFRNYGAFVSRKPTLVLSLSLVIPILLCIGLIHFTVETRPEKLWVSHGSKAAEEKSFFDHHLAPFYRIEQKDVFLISSNAMRYNAPDTIYYRQARTILDLAKKNFENLRQESDKEPETKTVVRRGRPPSKNINRPLGLPLAELAGLSKDPTLAIARGAANLYSATTDRPGTTDASAKVSYGLRSSDLFASISANKVDVREDYSGLSKESAGLSKEFATRFGKRAAVVEENRRNTYSQFQPYSYGCEMPILSVFDGEKKHLVAVGLHMEFAYARSLSRFAAHLGSIGWSIAANKIEKVLPPGTKYGRGWVGENESPQQSQPQIRSSSPSNQSSPCTEIRKCSNGHSQKLQPSCSDTATPACDGGTPDHGDDSEDQSAIPISGAGNEADPIIQPKTPFQVHWNRVKHSTTNGFTGGFRFNPPSQEGIVTSFSRPPMCFGSEPPLIHVRERDMALRNCCTASAATLIPTHSSHADSATAGTASSHPSFLSNPVRGQDHDSQLCGPSMQGKSEPIPPDLNVRLQSLGSPPSGAAVVDSQQPDLALQL